MPKKTKPLMIHKVPEEIKRQFKVACTAKGLTMREVILKLMETYAAQA